MTCRRIGIIGDVHGQARNLAKAIHLLRDRSVDLIVSVGDIVDGPESIDECCDTLISHHVIAVRGNHERWMFAGQMRAVANATSVRSLRRRSRDFLASLPAVRVLPVLGGTVVLSHGIGEDDMRELPRQSDKRLMTTLRRCHVVPPSCVGIISGHSHRRGSVRIAGTMLVEAGTLLPWKSPCYGILDCASKTAAFHAL